MVLYGSCNVRTPYTVICGARRPPAFSFSQCKGKIWLPRLSLARRTTCTVAQHQSLPIHHLYHNNRDNPPISSCYLAVEAVHTSNSVCNAMLYGILKSRRIDQMTVSQIPGRVARQRAASSSAKEEGVRIRCIAPRSSTNRTQKTRNSVNPSGALTQSSISPNRRARAIPSSAIRLPLYRPWTSVKAELPVRNANTTNAGVEACGHNTANSFNGVFFFFISEDFRNCHFGYFLEFL